VERPHEDNSGSPSRVELVEFLDDLRQELNEAQRAAQRAAEAEFGAGASDYILMRLEKTTVTLEVEYSGSISGEVGGKVRGKFWVFGSAEASASATASRDRKQTHIIVLELTPEWIERTDDAGGGTEPSGSAAGAAQKKNVLLADAGHRGALPPGFRHVGGRRDGDDEEERD
jgi:hypothetical protein